MSNELTKDNMELVKNCLERLRKLHDYNRNFKDCDIIATTMADLIISSMADVSRVISLLCSDKPQETNTGKHFLFENAYSWLLNTRLVNIKEDLSLEITPLLLQINSCMVRLTNYDRVKTDTPMDLAIALDANGEKEYWLKTVCPLSVMVGRLCKDLVEVNKVLELDYYTVPTFLASVIFTEIGICTEEIEMFGTEPVDTGDLPSKTNRSTLCQLGIITPIVHRNVQGYYAMTYLGYTTAEILRLMKRKKDAAKLSEKTV